MDFYNVLRFFSSVSWASSFLTSDFKVSGSSEVGSLSRRVLILSSRAFSVSKRKERKEAIKDPFQMAAVTPPCEARGIPSGVTAYLYQTLRFIQSLWRYVLNCLIKAVKPFGTWTELSPYLFVVRFISESRITPAWTSSLASNSWESWYSCESG